MARLQAEREAEARERERRAKANMDLNDLRGKGAGTFVLARPLKSTRS